MDLGFFASQYIIFFRNYTKCFPYFSFSSKCFLRQNISLDAAKTIVEEILSLKPAKIYLSGIKNYLINDKKWLKIMKKIYCTDWK